VTTPTVRCSSCDAEIVWAVTALGKRMPIDVTPTAVGNVVLEIDGDVLRARVVKTSDPRPRYVSHFATCPNANTHRKETRA
jgi:hypothetical protein